MSDQERGLLRPRSDKAGKGNGRRRETQQVSDPERGRSRDTMLTDETSHAVSLALGHCTGRSLSEDQYVSSSTMRRASVTRAAVSVRQI